MSSFIEEGSNKIIMSMWRDHENELGLLLLRTYVQLEVIKCYSLHCFGPRHEVYCNRQHQTIPSCRDNFFFSNEVRGGAGKRQGSSTATATAPAPATTAMKLVHPVHVKK